MRDKRYSITAYDAAIVYFKTLMKHLNVREEIDIAETALFNNYFNEWYENIENMLCVQKSFVS